MSRGPVSTSEPAGSVSGLGKVVMVLAFVVGMFGVAPAMGYTGLSALLGGVALTFVVWVLAAVAHVPVLYSR
jgi:hypothetical protein